VINNNIRHNIAASPPGREEAGDPANNADTLSTTHIRPFITFRWGSSILKSSKDRKLIAQGGGKRSKVSRFTKGSRRRLMNTIASIERDAELPDFVTLTYPENFPTIEQSKRDLKIFLQRLARKFPQSGCIWKLEPQERGAPHFHMLVWGCETKSLFGWVCDNWYDIAGQGDHYALLFLKGLLKDSKPCVAKVRSWRGVWSYASKYLGKTFEVAEWGNKWTGRYWGIAKRDNIPFGKQAKVDLTERQVIQIMRFQRRYAHIKAKDRNSLTTYCDVNQWINKLFDANNLS